MELFETFMAFRFILLEGIMDTLYMVFFSVLFGYMLGLPLGIILAATGKNGFMPMKKTGVIVGEIINIARSIPAIILMVVLIPFTRFIVGTALGNTAAIVPLTVASAPFVARLIESIINEIDQGVIDAAMAMGATKWQIITKVIIPESLPAIVRSLSITTIMLIGYSAIAGTIGAGGLGRIAIRFGFQGFNTEVMILTIIIIIIIVAVLQFFFNTIATKIDKRIR